MKNKIKIVSIIIMTWLLSVDVSAQTPIVVCPQSSSFSSMTRGYYFTAPTNFVICGIYVEDDMSTAFQAASIVRFTAGPPPPYSGTTNNFITLWQNLNYVPNNMIPVPNIAINTGDIIGIYGARSSSTINSYGPANCVINISGFPTTTYRSGMQFSLAAGPGMHDIWNENNGSIGRVTMYTGCCPPPVAIPSITGAASICEGDSATYTIPAQTNAISYNWTVPAGATIISGQNTTTLNVVWNTTPGGQICVDWTDACSTSPQTCLTVTVNPTPTVTVPANATYCDGASVPASAFVSTPSGATYFWTNSNTSIGMAASGTSNTPVFTASNLTSSVVTATIMVTPTVNGCVGVPVSYTISVNPTATVVQPVNLTYCNGDQVPVSTYTSIPSGGTYTWTNSDISIGLAATGIGNTPTFTATNITNAPITSTIIVTSTVNGCVGTPSNYTITVNPTPTVTLPVSATYCPGDIVPVSSFLSIPIGATYTWMNSNTAIGLAASGTGNIPSFTATNISGVAITGTITVTPTVNGCVGTPSMYDITVNPGATAIVPANVLVCSGDLIPASSFTTIPSGGTFTWTNSDPSIGLGASGTGNTPPFVATNISGSPITATISVIGTANGCPGLPSIYTITINTVVFATTNVSVCQGDSMLINGIYHSIAGNYLDTLSTPVGCDSILTYNLTINSLSSTTSNVVVCENDSILIEGGYYSIPGSYPFTYSNSFGCDSVITYNLTVSSLPSFHVTGAASINLGESSNLAVLPGVSGTTYSWIPPIGLSCLYCQNPIASPMESTWYYVTVTNAAGCMGIDSVYIEVDPSTNLYIPNIFSPNKDGNNDIYLVRGKGVEQFNLAIYNRWGQLVFESKDIEKGWDGTKDGTRLNQGVFVYKLNVIMYDGDVYNQTGNITLVR